MSENIKGIDQLNNSSILERVKHTLKEYKGTQDLDPENIKIVDVVTRVDEHLGVEHTEVIVKFQRGDITATQGFGVKEGESFGAAGEESLSPQEFDLVMSMARKENK
jgi:hypothetical protein